MLPQIGLDQVTLCFIDAIQQFGIAKVSVFQGKPVFLGQQPEKVFMELARIRISRVAGDGNYLLNR